jgi:hypothetical protein
MEFVGKFMTYNHTKFHMSSANNSLFSAIKQTKKNRESMLLPFFCFALCQIIPSTKIEYFWKIYYHT